MKLRHVEDYRRLRRDSYPEIGDQLDVIWKALSGLPQLSAEAATMLEQINNVKARFPKPGEAQ